MRRKPIAPGDWVHEHNVALHDFARDYRFAEGARNDEILPPELRATFQGYLRPNGKTGTRNYIGVLTSVNCSATVAKFIAEQVNRSGILDDYPQIDGVVPFVHGTGCGMAAKGEGWDVLRRTQWGYATHPNLGGALMVGLGCEVFQIDRMKDEYGLVEGEHFQTMTIQATGGTKKTVAEGVERIKAMLPVAARAQRETRPASEVTLALQCGGSDGYSGITANPALGAAVDQLVKHGGTGVLAETPEIYGAEHLLTRRALNTKVGEKLVERIRWWEEYTARNRGEMNNNPSPGNKAGGLTTILEKSLGAAAKGGSTTMRAVYEYAEPVTEKGFVFMDTPGYDPVGATGQVAGGCNVMCFTTGRGPMAPPGPVLHRAHVAHERGGRPAARGAGRGRRPGVRRPVLARARGAGPPHVGHLADRRRPGRRLPAVAAGRVVGAPARAGDPPDRGPRRGVRDARLQRPGRAAGRRHRRRREPADRRRACRPPAARSTPIPRRRSGSTAPVARPA